MKTRHALLVLLAVSGLPAIVGAGTAGEGEEENAGRLKTQKEQVMKLAVPILDRIDSFKALKDRGIDLEIECRRAKADLDQTKKTLEVAKIAIDEYEQGAYPIDLQIAKGTISLAESDLVRAKDRLEKGSKRANGPDGLDLQNEADKLAVDKAKYGVEKAKRELEVLTNFTRLKETTRLEAYVAVATSDMNDKKLTYDQLQNGLAALKQQLKNDPAPNRSELRILILLDKATTLQDENQLDEAQKHLDEAAQIARELEAQRAEIQFRATRKRIKKAMSDLKNPLHIFDPK
jgi:tetratricopeptide (TPR) repeat protein